MCKNDYKGTSKERDDSMSKVLKDKNYEIREKNTTNSLREVKLIREGKLSRKTARDFLKESRNSNK